MDKVINLKKIKIKKKTWVDVTLKSEYKSFQEEVIHANENMNENEKHIMTLIENQAPLSVDKSPRDYVIHLNKSMIGLLTLNVSIEKKTYSFLLDTGAEMSCISNQVFDLHKVKLLSDHIPVGDATGHKKSMKLGFLDALDLQGTEFRNIPILILDDQLSLKLAGIKMMQIDGIIGWDLLSHLDFEIDLNRQLMLITNGSHPYKNSVKSQFPVVIVEDSNKNLLKFGLDLGAKKTWISEDYCASRTWHQQQMKQKYIKGIHGPVKINQYAVGPFDVLLGDHEIKFKNIQTGFTGFIDDLSLDGVFGLDILKKHKLIVYNSQSVIHLENYENKFI